MAAGATSLQPPTDIFYGEWTTMLRDPFGHIWVFLTHVHELPVQEIVARGTALLQAGGHG